MVRIGAMTVAKEKKSTDLKMTQFTDAMCVIGIHAKTVIEGRLNRY
jgi:hypothetical protein